MARAITSPELADLRGAGQFSQLHLALHQPAVVFQAQLLGTPSILDGVVTLPYDNVQVGAFGDILPHMTLLVGTGQTGASRHDKGIIRVRKAADATNLYIGETSEVEFADNDWLTVVDEFSPFQRHLRIDAGAGNTVYMDYDVAYTDQHENFNPVPVMGSHAVGFLDPVSGEVDIQFDATNSWVYGDTIASYAWAVTGTATIDNATIAAPTITFDTAGTYRVSLVLTTTTGAKTTTGYRYVFIYDDANPPFSDFTLNSCTGAWDSGGWQFEVVAVDNAAQTDVRDEALVILFARDYYQGIEGSLGPEVDRENILALGWIDGETISWNADRSEVTFTVKGTQYWINTMPGYPVGVEDTDLPEGGVAPSWTAIADLTVGKGLFHFLYWRTTLCFCTDVYQQTDTRQLGAVEAPISSLWQQLLVGAYNAILAKPLSDHLGRIFTEIDPNHTPEGSRGSFPVVQDLTTADWYENLMIQRRPIDDVGYLEVSGVAYSNGVGTPICTRAYGTALAHHGRIERHERLALVDSTQAVELTGLMMGQLNNEFPLITIRLASNHRFFDIAPVQWATLNMTTASTIRGFDVTSHLIPRRVSYTYDYDSGQLLTDVQFEAETFGTNAVVTTCPEMPDLPVTTPDPPDWPEIPPAPTWTYIVLAYDVNNRSSSYARIYASSDFFSASSPTWINISAGIASEDLPYVYKIVSDARSATEVILYALVKRSFGTARYIKLYRMDNLLSLARWKVVSSYITNSTEAENVIASMAVSGANPDNLFIVGTDAASTLAGDCPSPPFYPTRFGWIIRNPFGVGGTRKILMTDTLACIGGSGTNDYRTNVIAGSVGSNNPFQLSHEIVSNAAGVTLAVFASSQWISPDFVGSPDIEGAWYSVFKATGGGTGFSLQESVRIYAGTKSIATQGRLTLRMVGDTAIFTHAEIGNNTAYTFRSTNAGVSFSNVDTVTGVNADFLWGSQNLDMSDDGAQAMTLSRKSSNGGATWSGHSAYNNILVAKCVRRVPGDADQWLIGGKGKGGFTRGVLYTTDFGVNWTDKTGTGMFWNPDVRYLDVIAVPGA